MDTAAHGAMLEISGTPRVISTEGVVALRRTAQEGLTNVAKHAPGTTPKVQLTFAQHEVVLTVTDTGGAHDGVPGPLAHTGGGYGIEGLRERAELLGRDADGRPRGDGVAGDPARARRPPWRRAGEFSE